MNIPPPLGMVEQIDLKNFDLPFWLMNFVELWWRSPARMASRRGSRNPGRRRRGRQAALFRCRRGPAAIPRRRPLITVDTPTPFRLSDVIAYIDDQLGKLDRTRLTLPYRRLKTAIEHLVADQRYNFMFGGLTVQDTMTDVLSRLFRMPNEGRPITVVDFPPCRRKSWT